MVVVTMLVTDSPFIRIPESLLTNQYDSIRTGIFSNIVNCNGMIFLFRGSSDNLFCVLFCKIMLLEKILHHQECIYILLSIWDKPPEHSSISSKASPIDCLFMVGYLHS